MSLGEWSVVQRCQQNRQRGKLHAGTHYWVSVVWQITWKCIPGISLAPNWKQTNEAFIPLNFSILSTSDVLSAVSDKGGSTGSHGSSHLRSMSNSKGTGKPWGESDFWALLFFDLFCDCIFSDVDESYQLEHLKLKFWGGCLPRRIN